MLEFCSSLLEIINQVLEQGFTVSSTSLISVLFLHIENHVLSVLYKK